MKTALITGITGQDGAYLARFLLDKGYRVFGTYRRASTPNFWRLQYLDLLGEVKLVPADMADMASLLEAVTVSDPHEIYNLAAQSYVSASFDQPLLTTEIDGSGAVRLLEIIRHINKDIKYYQASTSELYGTAEQTPQSEISRFWPNSPYAAAKLLSYHNTRIYREAYGLFAVNGILFNHESPLRGLEFVTRKITNAAAKIKLGLQEKVYLGNLEAKRDWGYAKEYVEVMWRMLQQDAPEDYVCATGIARTVREFAELAFRSVGLKYEDHVESHELFMRPKEVDVLQGDITKLTDVMNWRPRTTFEELVHLMVKADLKRWQDHMTGEVFPWDAFNYVDDLTLVKRHVIPRG
ncbi:MAG: GDP-mannose 4,6-dehydratase [Gammaproteobacteria bacterium]|nr:GDP-mannose 4,6-dehydratase [Gammaproteobacteria bacterium]NIR84259.1 GDP-mannose 4,6-dehydratase [Gammaproteobacteria bacterium]NIR89729.1 GDP-mannose 4,6-dehydratase [Gammaproteobacteria bacterium]NIU05417.1 GDP-mannose 4,6-dehydratase [Gammaproteobacteria bacterium]NIV52363.1 NAD-dependent epimerase/dehydratase family protein [Gammaproteobacteria bacterium]